MAANKPKESRQSNIAPADSGAEWSRMMQNAKELPDIHPKLKFGDRKDAEVLYKLEVQDDAPRFAEYEDKFKGGETGRVAFLTVRVLDGPDTPGALRSLAMPADENHGLTRGVLSVAKRHGGKLKGVCLSIETRNYNHKEFGPTRGFTVAEIQPTGSGAP